MQLTCTSVMLHFLYKMRERDRGGGMIPRFQEFLILDGTTYNKIRHPNVPDIWDLSWVVSQYSRNGPPEC